VLLSRFFADILLTPLEATRIRLVSDRKYATGLVSGFTRIAREGGIRELYAGFLPIHANKFPMPLVNLQSTNIVMNLHSAPCPKKHADPSPPPRNLASP